MNPLMPESTVKFGPRYPSDDDPKRRDNDWPGKRIDESTNPLPGETDYSDDDDDKDSDSRNE